MAPEIEVARVLSSRAYHRDLVLISFAYLLAGA